MAAKLPLLLTLFLFAVALSGCRQADKPEKTPDTMKKTEQEKSQTLESAHFLCFSGTSPVGTEVWTLRENPDGSLENHVLSRLTLTRFGESVTAEVEMKETLAADGNLRAFVTDVRMGGVPMRYSGKRTVNGLEMDVSTFGKEQHLPLESPEENIPLYGGYAAEVHLLRNPPHPGEERISFYRLEATLSTWVYVERTCDAAERVTFPTNRTFPLYPVKIRSFLVKSGQKTLLQEETFWCDGVGKIWKKESPLMQMTSWRLTPEEIAEIQAEAIATPAGEFDFAQAMSVPLENGTAAVSNSVKEVYVVTGDGVSPADVFTSATFQRVEKVDDRTARITVFASDTVLPDVPQSVPTPEDSQAGNLIQSDAPRIRALAEKATGGEASLAAAKKLERFVYEFITDKNYARGFATAAEVAEHPSGDCTEHAVFLAALLRAIAIPARVAQGLVYVASSNTFVWHVWNEAYLDGRWIPLDGTLGQGVVRADHLRINAGDFGNTTLAATLLPTAGLIGKIQIRREVGP
ncbi:MAG: transglutaminase-like domain-containing protein [Planctomycetia bacterium]|nr:transglutaminase-like domain-containing protein [Planctomycetia bacterium]